jgi:hypothetical protein
MHQAALQAEVDPDRLSFVRVHLHMSFGVRLDV